MVFYLNRGEINPRRFELQNYRNLTILHDLERLILSKIVRNFGKNGTTEGTTLVYATILSSRELSRGRRVTGEVAVRVIRGN